jgi:hypothetical protein
MHIYALYCFIFSITSSALMTNGIKVGNLKNWGFWLMLFTYFVMVLGGIASIIFAYLRLSKPGISESARNLVLKRHAASISIYILTNLNIIVTLVYACFGLTFPNPTPSESPWWTITLKMMFYMEGVLSPLIRLNEPIFRLLIIKTIKEDCQSVICFFYP